MQILNVGVLNVGFKPFTVQGEALGFEFLPDCEFLLSPLLCCNLKLFVALVDPRHWSANLSLKDQIVKITGLLWLWAVLLLFNICFVV